MLSRELTKLIARRCGDAPKPRSQRRSRALQIEPLEVRHLMDAGGLASLVSPSWFQDVPDLVGPQHAGVANWTTDAASSSSSTSAIAPQANASNLYDWIVQFDTRALGGIASVAETTSLLVGGGIEFQAIRGLGLAGQVLVRSSGASLDAVTQWLAGDTHVTGFEQDAIRQIQTTANDPQMGQLWGLNKIDAPEAWSVSTGGSGSNRVVVAVIDTGVDYNHPDLAANIWTNSHETAGNGRDDDNNGFADDIHGYDFANNDADPMDDNSHGTHVSGTIAGVGNNSRGVAGVNWSAEIMPLKFLNGQGSGYLSDAVRAINYATMERTQEGVNVRVINASWGGGGFSSAMDTAIRTAGDAGILFVAAAGNDAANNDASPHYPANYASANVISVAATDQNDRLATFSDYGATTVDIAAPGVSIYSTLPNNRYGTYSGTSMATPHVAGVAALAWAVDPNATVAEIRNAILQGADPVAALSGKVAAGGRLNAYNTLLQLSQATQGPAIASMTASSGQVAAGASVTLAVHGITSPAGTVANVCFYRDANGSGQYEASDSLVGSTTTVVGGEAGIAFNTTGLAPGTHRFFAVAVDGNARSSPPVTTTLSVVAADDHGNNAATATAVNVGGSVAGTINTGTDADWFKFQAVAGTSYTFSVQLGTLRDSVLSLYDRNGSTRLAYNDDYGGALASRIDWTAPASGTYYLAVAGYGTSNTGAYALSVQARNVAPQGPAIASMTASSGQVAAGASVTLAVHGITSPAGTVANVRFYRDANGSGQYEASDPLVGSATTVVGGEAGIALNTAGLAPGTHRFFAVAVDGNARSSPPVTTTLSVVAADDHGNNAATATAVNVGGSVAGTINPGTDADWFKFQAVAGTSYTFSVQLGTLRDSVLSLYDRNGATRLAYNDDYGGALASRIDWTAPASGTYYLAVAGYGNSNTGAYTLNVQARNAAPSFVARSIAAPAAATVADMAPADVAAAWLGHDFAWAATRTIATTSLPQPQAIVSFDTLQSDPAGHAAAHTMPPATRLDDSANALGTLTGRFDVLASNRTSQTRHGPETEAADEFFNWLSGRGDELLRFS